MTEYTERKQRVYNDLAGMQGRFESAAPRSLPWSFRNEVLEIVEKLPSGEQQHWKERYLRALNEAVEPLEDWLARQGGASQNGNGAGGDVHGG